MIALMAAEDGLHVNQYRKWALSQINYILGDNNYGLSYVIGFGNKYPLHAHHTARYVIFGSSQNPTVVNDIIRSYNRIIVFTLYINQSITLKV